MALQCKRYAFTLHDGNDVALDREVPDNVCLESVGFSPQVISRVIRKIKPKTSSGPDGFPPILAKKVASSLTFPLSEIFRSFMSVSYTHLTLPTIYSV